MSEFASSGDLASLSKFASTKLGVMQGRLVEPEGGRVQSFPATTWRREFALAAEAGLNCIEFIFDEEVGGNWGGRWRAHPLMNDEGIESIGRLIDETGVGVLSVCADYFMDHPLHKGGEEAEMAEALKVLVGNSAALGVKDVVIPCVDQSTLAGDEEKERFRRSLEGAMDLAESRGVNLALETDMAPGPFVELIESLGSMSIKVNYDTGNSAGLGYDPVEELEAYGSYVTDVHIKDRVLGGTTVPLGSGSADFPAFFGKLGEVGFDGHFILQAARGVDGAELETIKGYMEFVRKFTS